jgi:PAS domain S-box-containing protein
LAVAGLSGALAWWGTDAFSVQQAARGARSVLLAHRAMQLYAMRPVPSPPSVALAEERARSELVSPSVILREQRRIYDEERLRMGFPPVAYRIASDDPLNPANRPDEREAALLSSFNARRDMAEYQAVIQREGRTYLYLALPFPANTQACLGCHGDRAAAPAWLRERYPGPEGFGERPGRVRAVESVLLPIAAERRWAVTAVAMLLALAVLMSGLVLSNRWLSRRVKERTEHLERETAGRLQAEEALRMTQFAVDLMPDAVYRLTRDGTIVYANEAGVRELGYTREEVIGKLQAERVNEEVTPGRLAEIRDILERGGTYRTEGEHHRKDGSVFPVDVCTSRMQFGDGEYLWVVARDLTSRKRLEAQVLEAQKMEAIGTLAGGIAHDFNNILSALVGFAELARESMPAGCTGREDVEQILEASARARDLVRQILDFSRKSRRDKQPLQVGRVAAEALKLLRATLPATVEVRDRIDLELWAVADPTGFHQIVMNLCTNAFQAMAATGGLLVVELTRADAAAGDIPPSRSPGPCVHLKMSDTGPGMSPEVSSHVFEPYFTTRRSAGGSGLGLSVVHGIVTSYGGTVTVKSELGHGATFDVWLPIAQPPASAARNDDGNTRSGHERILVVDDEQAVRTVSCRMLTGLGYGVRAAAGPEEALGLYRQDPGAFDLVLTDQTMPKMTGLALIERLREISPSVRVVLMTGFSPTLLERSTGEMGIDAILSKPFTRRELAAAVHAALGGGARRRRGRRRVEVPAPGSGRHLRTPVAPTVAQGTRPLFALMDPPHAAEAGPLRSPTR